MPERCAHVSEFSYRTECKSCRERREAREKRHRDAAHVEFYERTGHCGQCGNPGTWCQCTTDCGCAGLHELGSGIGVDPAEMFSDVPVSSDQGELFS